MQSFDRLVRMVQRGYEGVGKHGAPSFALQLPGGEPAVFGRGEPAATVVVNDRRGAAALATMDALAVCEAYLSGALDVVGEIKPLLALRSMFNDRHPLRSVMRFVRPLIAGQVSSDRAFIAEHYDREPEFYLSFWTRATAAIRRASLPTRTSRWRTPLPASWISRWIPSAPGRGTGCWTWGADGARLRSTRGRRASA